MATLLGNTQVNPGSGGNSQCIAPNNTATMGRGFLGGTGGTSQATACQNTVLGFRIANYSAANHKNNTLMGYMVALGFGNSAACNLSCENTFIGSKAGYGTRSGASGAACGLRNVALGHRTGQGIQFSRGNIFVFPFSGFSINGVANHNIGIGDVAFRGYSTTGCRNIAIGCASLQAINSACSDNIFIGVRAGRYGQYPTQTTAVGFGSSCGGGPWQNLGTSIGAYAFTSGCCSTVIGKSASGGYSPFANKVSITVNCNPWYAAGHTILGNANNIDGYIATGWTNLSDYRDKTNIGYISPNLGLPFIKKLRPVKFNWDKRDKYVQKCGFEWGQKDGTLVEEREQYGFIAQEIEEAINELNVSFEALGKHKGQHNENVDVYDLKYLDLISPMVQSLKDLIEDLENTEARVEVLKA
jgi:hypothetical protein